MYSPPSPTRENSGGAAGDDVRYPKGMSETQPVETQEIELVTQATAGNLGAFEELVSRYQRAVFNIAVYKSKNYFDAEDLTQDIFLAAFKALSTLKAPESFGAWLFGIAYNRCHKWYQRERNKILKIQEIKQRVAREERMRHRASMDPQASGSWASGSWASSSSGSESSSGTGSTQVSELLRKLPQEVRDTLTLKYLDGLSYQDIENRMGINAHRIDYLIRKGKQLIRQRLGQTGEGVF